MAAPISLNMLLLYMPSRAAPNTAASTLRRRAEIGERAELIEMDPVAGGRQPDPADAVMIEELPAAHADAVGDVGDVQRRDTQRGEPAASVGDVRPRSRGS